MSRHKKYPHYPKPTNVTAVPEQPRHLVSLDEKFAEAMAEQPAQKRKVGTDEGKQNHVDFVKQGGDWRAPAY